jgi:hypothetical protein
MALIKALEPFFERRSSDPPNVVRWKQSRINPCKDLACCPDDYLNHLSKWFVNKYFWNHIAFCCLLQVGCSFLNLTYLVKLNTFTCIIRLKIKIKENCDRFSQWFFHDKFMIPVKILTLHPKSIYKVKKYLLPSWTPCGSNYEVPNVCLLWYQVFVYFDKMYLISQDMISNWRQRIELIEIL